MGKFSPTNYDPRKDSSPNTEAYRPGYKGDPPGLAGVILDRTTLPEPYAHLRPCPCGCRQPLAAGSTYRMGHDMRLKGILIRAHLTATDVNVLGDGGTWTGPAIEEAARWSTANLDWEVMLKEAEAKQGPSV
ncbi:MAG TPA: hypothetical protein VNN79_19835, partial [Actinomycetota bacterium]|nr:hypothetical protein [Actinomycetota bacterium]